MISAAESRCPVPEGLGARRLSLRKTRATRLEHFAALPSPDQIQFKGARRVSHIHHAALAERE
jgi:hypothetical protein